MSNPNYYGSRSDVGSTKSKLGMSNGSLDSRASLISNPRDAVRQKKRQKKKSVYLWTPCEVRHWLQKRHRKYYELYCPLFQEHDISGRALVRLDEMKLERMGIENREHRADLREHILRLRIKHERTELNLLCKSEQEGH